MLFKQNAACVHVCVCVLPEVDCLFSYRFIVMRRMFALTGTVFMLRCITMLITSLSVPGVHLQCEPKVDTS